MGEAGLASCSDEDAARHVGGMFSHTLGGTEADGSLLGEGTHRMELSGSGSGDSPKATFSPGQVSPYSTRLDAKLYERRLLSTGRWTHFSP